MTGNPKLNSLLLGVIALAGAALGAFLPGLFRPAPTPVPPPATAPAPPTEPRPEPKPEPKPDTLNAIGRIQFGQSGCTATVIGPRRSDGKWNVLTAAHCVTRVGEAGVMRFRDGRTTGIVVAAFDRTSDACWCVTADAGEYPFAWLADTTPPIGKKVWHAGYGVDVPANREDGEVKAGPNGSGQSQFWLSVSPGDSGGGICLDESGRVISPTCCTTRLAAPGDVWGASPESCRRLLAQVTLFQVFDDWKPAAMPPPPMKMPEK
jgi:hypothetical protein